MRFFKLTLSYDGTDYAGWQIQPREKTIQQELEDALKQVTSRSIRITASGRTDAGVHALGQVVSFSMECSLSTDTLVNALNANLPQDIVVLKAVEAEPGFHAIRDAIGKRYRYVINNGAAPDVFRRNYEWFLTRPLDSEAMHRAAQTILGTHDFACFQSSGSERNSTVRTITDIFVTEREEGSGRKIVIEVAADGFLYNMVRTIVGSLVEVGKGAKPENWLREVVMTKDRKMAGRTAPAEGLILVSVDY